MGAETPIPDAQARSLGELAAILAADGELDETLQRIAELAARRGLPNDREG